MFFGCALDPSRAEKLNKEWLLTVSLESAATASEVWTAAGSAVKKQRAR